MGKNVAIAALSGIILGYILQFVFPSILKLELQYNFLTRKQISMPLYETYRSGSVLDVGILFPLFLGLAGGLIGIIVFKFFSRNTRMKV